MKIERSDHWLTLQNTELNMNIKMFRLILTKDLNMKICSKVVLKNLGSKQKLRIKIISDLSARFWGTRHLEETMSDDET
jgi:hypothetical protein